MDVYDICLGKIFSRREKDLDDLRAVKSRIEKDQLAKQLINTGQAFLADPELRGVAERNWYILFGENLPG